MQKLIDAGMGDVPLTRLRFRCSNCRSSLTDLHWPVGYRGAALAASRVSAADLIPQRAEASSHDLPAFQARWNARAAVCAAVAAVAQAALFLLLNPPPH